MTGSILGYFQFIYIIRCYSVFELGTQVCIVSGTPCVVTEFFQTVIVYNYFAHICFVVCQFMFYSQAIGIYGMILSLLSSW